MKKNQIIYNFVKINKFVLELAEKENNQKISNWIRANFLNFLVKKYENRAVVFPESLDYNCEPKIIQKAIDNNESIVNIKITNKIKRDVEHVIDYLKSKKAPKNITRMTYEDASKHAENWTIQLNKVEVDKNDIKYENLNIIKDFGEYFLVQLETKEEFALEGKLMNHCVLDYYDRYKRNSNFCIWSMRDKNNKPSATIEVNLGRNNESINIVQFKGRFNRGMIDFKSARIFYDYLHEKYNYVYFHDESAFGIKMFIERENKRIPFTLWKNGGEIHGNLNLTDQYVNNLPEELTVYGSLYMENTQICYLGNKLKVKGDIHANGSQLAVIDDIEVEGNIYAKDTLLSFYPEKLKNKISTEKEIYVPHLNKTYKV